MARIELGSGRQTFLLERTGGSDRITDFRAQYFEATLDEAQEVPPNPDIAGISGTGVGALNFARSEFDFHLEIEGIDLAGGGAPDDMTDMHIHGAAAGDTGPVIFDFRTDAETDVAAGAGTVDGSWDKNEPAALDLTGRASRRCSTRRPTSTSTPTATPPASSAGRSSRTAAPPTGSTSASSTSAASRRCSRSPGTSAATR